MEQESRFLSRWPVDNRPQLTKLHYRLRFRQAAGAGWGAGCGSGWAADGFGGALQQVAEVGDWAFVA